MKTSNVMLRESLFVLDTWSKSCKTHSDVQTQGHLCPGLLNLVLLLSKFCLPMTEQSFCTCSLKNGVQCSRKAPCWWDASMQPVSRHVVILAVHVALPPLPIWPGGATRSQAKLRQFILHASQPFSFLLWLLGTARYCRQCRQYIIVSMCCFSSPEEKA